MLRLSGFLCYSRRMPKTLVRSLRMTPEMWDWVVARAARRNMTVNAWLSKCVADAREQIEKPKVAVAVAGPVASVPGSRLKKR